MVLETTVALALAWGELFVSKSEIMLRSTKKRGVLKVTDLKKKSDYNIHENQDFCCV